MSSVLWIFVVYGELAVRGPPTSYYRDQGHGGTMAVPERENRKPKPEAHTRNWRFAKDCPFWFTWTLGRIFYFIFGGIENTENRRSASDQL
ncbi:hypothetical protein DFH94DRAFT_229757 [Russula ochroleuca]|uniref:Secreted protein n=1 Tax=Russula ochroleuca TaxID=152965 RepID=A0A9P5JXM4_9AGAM|nr:hypothetical protein DFH94DRAFT_229757 [Russula ochroleuca]